MDLARCAVCRFWRPIPVTVTGHCRRHPPSPVVFVHTVIEPNGDVRGEFVDYQTLWPVTNGNDWCGQHESPGPA